MDIRKKMMFFTILLVVGISIHGFSQIPDLKEVQNGVAELSLNLAKSLPFNSSLGMNWSDAYIGKLFPSMPPHLGVGGAFGFTTLELPLMRTLAGYFGYKLPFDTGRLFLPAYTAEARLGGLFLPFDIGFKFGYLPPIGLWGTDMNMNYLLAGGDIRFAVLDKAVLPKISFGVGLNYLKAGVSGSAGRAQKIEYGNPGNFITLERPDVSINWDTIALDFKLQVSKSILLVTPYLGLGGSYAWSSAGYSVDAKITNSGGNEIDVADINAINNYLHSIGVEGTDINGKGLSSVIKNNAFSFRAFGGFSVNLMMFKLDLTGLYNFRDSNFGGSFGFRFQV